MKDDDFLQTVEDLISKNTKTGLYSKYYIDEGSDPTSFDFMWKGKEYTVIISFGYWGGEEGYCIWKEGGLFVDYSWRDREKILTDIKNIFELTEEYSEN